MGPCSYATSYDVLDAVKPFEASTLLESHWHRAAGSQVIVVNYL